MNFNSGEHCPDPYIFKVQSKLSNCCINTLKMWSRIETYIPELEHGLILVHQKVSGSGIQPIDLMMWFEPKDKNNF